MNKPFYPDVLLVERGSFYSKNVERLYNAALNRGALDIMEQIDKEILEHCKKEARKR